MAHTQLLLMIVSLTVLLGTGLVFLKVQCGTIESPKIVVGACLLLALSGLALAIVAVQDSAVRADAIERTG
jgi:protein-S-isoprenylcysteine O-methyltransferase Ste14